MLPGLKKNSDKMKQKLVMRRDLDKGDLDKLKEAEILTYRRHRKMERRLP